MLTLEAELGLRFRLAFIRKYNLVTQRGWEYVAFTYSYSLEADVAGQPDGLD